MHIFVTLPATVASFNGPPINRLDSLAKYALYPGHVVHLLEKSFGSPQCASAHSLQSVVAMAFVASCFFISFLTRFPSPKVLPAGIHGFFFVFIILFFIFRAPLMRVCEVHNENIVPNEEGTNNPKAEHQRAE
jgi:hypothetical protein